MELSTIIVVIVGLAVLWFGWHRLGASASMDNGLNTSGSAAAVEEGNHRLAYLADAINKKAIVATVAKSFLKNKCFKSGKMCEICCTATAKVLPKFGTSSCEKFCGNGAQK